MTLVKFAQSAVRDEGRESGGGTGLGMVLGLSTWWYVGWAIAAAVVVIASRPAVDDHRPGKPNRPGGRRHHRGAGRHQEQHRPLWGVKQININIDRINRGLAAARGARRMILAVSTGTSILCLVGLAVGWWSSSSSSPCSTASSAPPSRSRATRRTILDGGIGIAKGVDGVDDLARTRELVTTVPPLAVAYLEIVEGAAVIVALASSVETAWWVTLAVALVIVLVVWFLLEWLRRTVNEVDRAVDDVWVMGKRVAQNTATTHARRHQGAHR